jgi:hypothetical protein
MMQRQSTIWERRRHGFAGYKLDFPTDIRRLTGGLDHPTKEQIEQDE